MKRKLERKFESNKKTKIDSNILPEDRIKFNTTPLWNMPYDEQVIYLSFVIVSIICKFIYKLYFQLEFKQNEMKSVINKMGEEILKVNKDLAGWFNKQIENNDGLPCKLEKIVHSDIIEGYRNKCEFTVGKILIILFY
jgi:tRNA (uracil-5-)-methyltransferase